MRQRSGDECGPGRAATYRWGQGQQPLEATAGGARGRKSTCFSPLKLPISPLPILLASLPPVLLCCFVLLPQHHCPPPHPPARCPAPGPGSCRCGRTACLPESRLRGQSRPVGGAVACPAGKNAPERLRFGEQKATGATMACPSRGPNLPKQARTREGRAEHGDAVLPGPVVDGVGVVDLPAQPRNHLLDGARRGQARGARAG